MLQRVFVEGPFLLGNPSGASQVHFFTPAMRLSLESPPPDTSLCVRSQPYMLSLKGKQLPRCLALTVFSLPFKMANKDSRQQ